MHISCTICTDVVEPDENIHATRCGHVFHNHCLSDWIVRSNTCPQCRRVVTDNCMLRIYPTFSDEKDLASLQSRMHHTLELYKELQTVCAEKEENLRKAREDLRKNEESLEIFMSELDNRNSAVEALQQRLEAVHIQNTEVQLLKVENASLKDNVRTLNGEIQRQNLLYGEFMAQISIQRNSLEAHGKETALLRAENASLKKTLRSLKGELRRHKLLNEELKTQVSLQKDQKSNLDSQSNLKQSKDIDSSLKNNERRPKMVLNRVNKVELKTIEPRKSSPAQAPDMAPTTEKMNVLSQKLSLAKSSHLKLSRTVVNLIVAWLKLKVTKIDEQNSLSTTSQSLYEDDFVTRLSKILTVDESKLQLENTNIVAIEKDTRKRQSEISPDLTIPASEQTKNSIKIVTENDIKRMSDFFTKFSEREPEKICKKEDAKRQSTVLSHIDNTWSNSEITRDDFQNAIQRVLVSDFLKNYEKNFKRFDVGVLNIKKEQVKNKTGRKCAKQKGKEAFEFDVTRMYEANNVVRRSSVFSFAARGLPKLPPMPLPPAAFNKAAAHLAKKKKESARPPAASAAPRRCARARRRRPPGPAPPGHSLT